MAGNLQPPLWIMSGVDLLQCEQGLDLGLLLAHTVPRMSPPRAAHGPAPAASPAPGRAGGERPRPRAYHTLPVTSPLRHDAARDVTVRARRPSATSGAGPCAVAGRRARDTAPRGP